MDEQKVNSYFSKLMSNARAIVSYQVGLPVGCLKMGRILYWLENEGHAFPEFLIFRQYLAETNDLPTGSERLHCSRDALRRYDERLVAVNLAYREEIIDACFRIISRYGEVASE